MQSLPSYPLSRRALLQRMGTGLGTLGLATVLADNGLLASEAPAQSPLAPKPSHFRPQAKIGRAHV